MLPSSSASSWAASWAALALSAPHPWAMHQPSPPFEGQAVAPLPTPRLRRPPACLLLHLQVVCRCSKPPVSPSPPAHRRTPSPVHRVAPSPAHRSLLPAPVPPRPLRAPAWGLLVREAHPALGERLLPLAPCPNPQAPAPTKMSNQNYFWSTLSASAPIATAPSPHLALPMRAVTRAPRHG